MASHVTARQVVEIFGHLGKAVSTADDLRAWTRRGLPVGALDVLVSRLGVTGEQLGRVLAVPPRTWARRKRASHLTPQESDRLLRVARVFASARQVLGDDRRAVAWLVRTNRALGGHDPLSLLDTDAGTRQVEDILGRIDHGIYS